MASRPDRSKRVANSMDNSLVKQREKVKNFNSSRSRQLKGSLSAILACKSNL